MMNQTINRIGFWLFLCESKIIFADGNGNTYTDNEQQEVLADHNMFEIKLNRKEE